MSMPAHLDGTDLIDNLVAAVDAVGGPAALAAQPILARFTYEPVTRIDQSLSPYSDTYFQQMMSLYTEVSGRALDQFANEQSELNVSDHVNAAHPYAVRDPSRLVVHYQRLAKLLRYAKLPNEAQVLDLGAGWGLTTEFLAQLGCTVTAVDINPKFVELVSRRAARLGYDIRALVGSFDDFEPTEKFDAVLFYECFHHAISPWRLAEKVAGWLKPKGAMLLAGEPIQSAWWKHWGLRMDGLSIYCIRKFGWFESGWSQEFLIDLLGRAGLRVQYIDDPDPEVGAAVVATRYDDVPIGELASDAEFSGWLRDEQYLVCLGQAALGITIPNGRERVALLIHNFRQKPIDLVIHSGGTTLWNDVLQSGDNFVFLRLTEGRHVLCFASTTWSPQLELGSADDRIFSFHLARLSV